MSGLCETSYDTALFSQRLISKVETNEYQQKHKIDIPIADIFVSKDCHPVVLAESIVDRWFVGTKYTKQTYKVKNHKGVKLVTISLSH